MTYSRTIRRRAWRAALTRILRLAEVALWFALWPPHRLWCARFGHDWYYAARERECYRCGLTQGFAL